MKPLDMLGNWAALPTGHPVEWYSRRIPPETFTLRDREVNALLVDAGRSRCPYACTHYGLSGDISGLHPTRQSARRMASVVLQT